MKRKRRRIRRNPGGSGIVTYALAGIGGLWLWTRYKAAKAGGVSLVDALKAPFDDAKKLAQKAIGAPKNGNGATPPAASNDIPPDVPEPYQPDYGAYENQGNYDADAPLTPQWIADQ